MDEEFDKDVPIPAGWVRANRSFTWIGRMQVGDSKAIEKSRRGGLSTAIRRQKLRAPGQAFTTRVTGDEIRVWRTA